MSAYVIVDVAQTDADAAARYRDLAATAAARHGGRYVARGGARTVLEGDWAPERIVVIEFASVDAARAWYESPEYTEARAVRADAGRWNMIVVEGVAG